ncbi:hypothetical protein [Pseudomonas chlororaphis]|uniref:hypothetical protein n=1 Tax=Pseudomonas chlororaphis TaxID=587753 RepID=UPI001CF58A82|nr:hypothetical protein [Pseudomonas chlororaphis]UCR83191.1 hypothetical protein K9V45_23635 [Pseudomonas chlororaphis]
MENTGILQAGQITDPANNADTETGLKIGFQGWHEGHGVQRNHDQAKAPRNQERRLVTARSYQKRQPVWRFFVPGN